jgi:hypothetical protein
LIVVSAARLWRASTQEVANFFNYAGNLLDRSLLKLVRGATGCPVTFVRELSGRVAPQRPGKRAKPTMRRRDTAPRLVYMFEEQRVEPRERLALPLKLGDGTPAVTRDVSATGLFFVTDGEYAMEGLVDFEMHLLEARMKFTSIGRIIRLEFSDGRTGVAVRLMNPRLEAVEQ